jgi:osmotically-inducible protein OsmY
LAQEDARDVVGVAWVTNNVTVQGDTRNDAAIKIGLDFELGVDPLLQELDIQPSVKGGVLTLAGTVHTLYEKTHAAEVATRVKGIQGIVNKLAVDGDTRQSDTVLDQMVRSRLMQNAITAPAVFRMQAKVNNGIATLTGRVDTWVQRTEAERVALGTEGIWRVDNRLQVNGYDYPWDQQQYKGDFHFDPLYMPTHFFDYGP